MKNILRTKKIFGTKIFEGKYFFENLKWEIKEYQR
jgi:hypothetical protein